MAIEIYILKRIEMIQLELDQLKKVLLAKSRKKPVSLWGIWQGIDISDKEIEETRHSLFKTIDDNPEKE